MEMTTRKRPAEGGEKARRTRARGGEVDDEKRERSVTDDKVDEFFAILSRIREATRCFTVRDGNGGVRRSSTAAERLWRWQPTFQREDFEEASGVGDDRRWRGNGGGGERRRGGGGGKGGGEHDPGEPRFERRPGSRKTGSRESCGDSTAPVAF